MEVSAKGTGGYFTSITGFIPTDQCHAAITTGVGLASGARTSLKQYLVGQIITAVVCGSGGDIQIDCVADIEPVVRLTV